MNEQDKIKKCALEKYKQYVECELKRLNDGCLDGSRLSITDYEPMPSLKDGFNDKDMEELMPLIESLQKTIDFVKSSKKIGIDLSKYPNIKGLCQK